MKDIQSTVIENGSETVTGTLTDSQNKDFSASRRKQKALRKKEVSGATVAKGASFDRRLVEGTIVQLHSLRCASLNDEIGVVMGFDVPSESDQVKLVGLDGGSATKFFNAVNLKALEGDDDCCDNYLAHVADDF